MDYKNQIKNPLWQKKRLKIFELHNFTCEVCGAKDKTLHVHHLRYIKGRKYWEYDNDVLMCLCEDCHTKEHQKKDDIKVFKTNLAEQKLIEIFREANNKIEKFNNCSVIYFLDLLESNINYTEPLKKLKLQEVFFDFLKYFDNEDCSNHFVNYMQDRIELESLRSKAEITKLKSTPINDDVIEEISIRDLIKQEKEKICKNCQLLEVFDRSENNDKIEIYACSEKGILQNTLTTINKKTLKAKIDKKCFFPIDKKCCEMFKMKEIK